ncbi:ankyrin repeat-containing domain protein [Mycotypha africana]|uniref:ankyrin repeat-containing domain protein n=1 Tax=Mycotypha africana TaxID=64632 RepID=UPI002301F1A6|nr:ankyrin repeat-containing domain protein [Mycotypha africana]KAI8991459.1 ankyrin repeat-containing domain protein [Mycotypha africana]
MLLSFLFRFLCFCLLPHITEFLLHFIRYSSTYLLSNNKRKMESFSNTNNTEDHYRALSLPAPPTTSKRTFTDKGNRPSFTRFRKYEETKHEQQLRNIITEVDCTELQNRLKIAMDKIILSWSERHDALIDALDRLEQSKQSLQYRLSAQSHSYERCLKQCQYFKTRYEALLANQQQRHHFHRASESSLFSNISSSTYSGSISRRSLLMSSNASCLSGKSGYSTSSSSSSGRSSCASSIRTSTISFSDDFVEPLASIVDSSSNIIDDSSGDPNQTDDIDIFTVLSETEDLNLALSPDSTNSLLSPVALATSNIMNSTTNMNNNESQHDGGILHREHSMLSQQQQNLLGDDNSRQILKFGCTDGFWIAISNGYGNKKEVANMVLEYLRRGGDPNVAKNTESMKNVKEGYSLIHALITVKNTPALRAVIDAGGKGSIYPLTLKKEDKIAPVVLAAKMGYINGVKLLVERAGANLMLDRGPYGENALHAAVQSGSEDMARCVLKLCNNDIIECKDDNGIIDFRARRFKVFSSNQFLKKIGLTPLHYACITGKLKIITVFARDAQCNVDAKCNKNETPLHYAIRNQRFKVVAKLIGELGAYPNHYVLKQVQTPLDLAKQADLKNIADYLRNAGAKTTKEMEKANRKNQSIKQLSNSYQETKVLTDEHSNSNTPVLPPHPLGVRHFLQTKTSQILRSTF